MATIENKECDCCGHSYDPYQSELCPFCGLAPGENPEEHQRELDLETESNL